MFRNTLPNGLQVIQIGFFASSRNACACGHRYAHVELRFSDYSVTSITRAPTGKVHIIPDKRMSNTNYCCFFELAVNPEVEERMMSYAQTNNAEFSVLAMYLNFLCCFTIRSRGTFCSAYVCRLLQLAGMCNDLDPDRTSPDHLFEALAADDRVVCSFNNRF
jgi:hypothetical protein